MTSKDWREVQAFLGRLGVGCNMGEPVFIAVREEINRCEERERIEHAVKSLHGLINSIETGKVRVVTYDMSRPAVEVEPSPEGWQRCEPSRFTTLTLVYETPR